MPRPDARAVTAAVRAGETSPLDELLFGAAPPEPDRTTAPEPPTATTVPTATMAAWSELAPDAAATDDVVPVAPAPVEAAPRARSVGPRPRTPRSVVAAIEVEPAAPGPTYGRSRFFQLTVPLPLETHAALRDAAVARGSIREMSIIVREAIETYLRHLEAMGESERQASLAEATAALSAARARGRRDVAYRLEEDQRARLLPFSGAQGIPMSAIAAAAISSALLPTG
jgi:predicted DNA-binding protein